ncbi:DUF421 domain-containing protein [Fictibacillus sp. BK138]|uniref:DUF421 domain-containing protein n=1 Tax=Fictibacillus sp. BK138 TaxID=2512121 RepID=UPI001028C510|nr:YetF domain-containing protein [Fictibacillus sp. BK138]RZT23644.1 uncharacterized protein DUF421 [Fictibacillus sp. BK138]
MFFSSWDVIVRTVIVGVLSYTSLIILLRVSGKRTLSKMNAFDLVVTVALGSTLATILLNKNVKYTEGITAMLVLIGMQYIVAWLSVRSKSVQNLVKASPELLYYHGRYLDKTMKKARVQTVEILQAARSSGIHSMEQVEAVVLETDGSMSVLKKSDKQERSTLRNVKSE